MGAEGEQLWPHRAWGQQGQQTTDKAGSPPRQETGAWRGAEKSEATDATKQASRSLGIPPAPWTSSCLQPQKKRRQRGAAQEGTAGGVTSLSRFLSRVQR